MDRENQRYNLFDEIDTKKDDWNIRVRVTRMWEVLNIKTNNELMSVDLVLLDEKVSFEIIYYIIKVWLRSHGYAKWLYHIAEILLY